MATDIQKQREEREAAEKKAAHKALNYTMLYKYPGSKDIQGDKFDTKVVPETGIAALEADGWSLTPQGAKEIAISRSKTSEEESETIPSAIPSDEVEALLEAAKEEGRKEALAEAEAAKKVAVKKVAKKRGRPPKDPEE